MTEHILIAILDDILTAESRKIANENSAHTCSAKYQHKVGLLALLAAVTQLSEVSAVYDDSLEIFLSLTSVISRPSDPSLCY